jgi:hypothetical protein
MVPFDIPPSLRKFNVPPTRFRSLVVANVAPGVPNATGCPFKTGPPPSPIGVFTCNTPWFNVIPPLNVLIPAHVSFAF